MRRTLLCALITASLVAACVPVAYKAIPPERAERNGDIQISTPSHRTRASREEAAERCAQYGRVARHRGGNDYDCVAPNLASNQQGE